MIIAITGGTGFIGKRLTNRLLQKGHHIRLLSRTHKISSNPRLEHFQGDLNNLRSINNFLNEVDVLFHCAGETRNPNLMEQTHIQGTQNLITSTCSKQNKLKKWIQLSSVGVYGKSDEKVVTEVHPYNPNNLYEKTKAESDHLVLEAYKTGRIEPVLLRPSNVYGPEMSYNYLYQLIASVDKKLFFFIGKRGALMSNIHVDNVIHALLLCAEQPNTAGKIFNLSDELPIETYIEILARHLHKPTPRLRLPKTPLIYAATILEKLIQTPLTSARIEALSKHSRYDCSRIKSELGYKHVLSLEEGLVEMVNHYKRRRTHA